MKLRESDIFNEFAKICVEKGIIKEAEKHEPAESKEKISTIEMLYGVKPESIYKKDLLDEAHPEPVVYSRSHDKLNGLIENLKERQSVMVGIVNKPTTGKQTHQSYVRANKELMDQVIKVAMIGAQIGDEDLMRFSELCADRIEKKANPYLIAAGVIAGVAAIVGMIASQNYSVQQGVLGDIATFKKEMEEASSNYPAIGQEVSEIMPEVDRLHDLFLAAVNLPYPKARTKKQMAQFGAKLKQSVQFKKSKEAWVHLKEQLETVRDMIPSVVTSLKEKEKMVSNPEGHWNWVAGLIKAWRKISPTDIEDAYVKLEDLGKSINEFLPNASKQLAAYDRLENTEIDEEAINNFEEKPSASLDQAQPPTTPGSASSMKKK